MQHQDWEVITLKPKKPKVETTQVARTQQASKPVKTDENDEVISVKKVTMAMAQIVIQSRVAKKMTQVDLGKACCLESKIINEIERGNCIYNAEHINKISKVLGVKIPRG